MIINLISGPRNISTALMYSFAQRADTRVIDEPFYGNYLLRYDADHPGKKEIIAHMETDIERIVAGIAHRAKQAAGEEGRNLTFVKNMGHHLVDMDTRFLNTYQNVFLIRDPAALIASLAEILPDLGMRDVGLSRQAELFHELADPEQKTPIVIDSHEVLKDPPLMLQKLCAALAIPYSAKMLSWKKGEIHDSVPWAADWYKNVLNSTGFEKQSTSTRPFPERYRPLLDLCRPHYEFLKSHALTR